MAGSTPTIRMRRRAQRAMISAGFHALASAGRLHPRSRLERHGVERLKNIRYAPGFGEAHLLDVYRPSGRDPARDGLLPVILYVHGGGFAILSKDTHWLMALAFARRGYVVFNVNYRLAPRHPFPLGLSDVCAAARWVKKHARSYGGDPERLALAGESAGANLITALTVAACYRRPEPWAREIFDADLRPRAAMPACGILQVSDAGRFARRYPQLMPLVADRIADVCANYLPEAYGPRAASPGAFGLADPLVELERGLPPDKPLPAVLATCGTRDPLIGDSKRLTAAAEALGARARLEIYPGGVHAFHAFAWRPEAQRCWADHYDFLDACFPEQGGE